MKNNFILLNRILILQDQLELRHTSTQIRLFPLPRYEKAAIEKSEKAGSNLPTVLDDLQIQIKSLSRQVISRRHSTVVK